MYNQNQKIMYDYARKVKRELKLFKLWGYHEERLSATEADGILAYIEEQLKNKNEGRNDLEMNRNRSQEKLE